MLGVGLTVDLAAHTHLIGAAGVIAVVVSCFALLRSGRLSTLVIRLETLPLKQAATLTDRLCSKPQTLDGGWSWNRSRADAYDARRVLCHWQ